VAGCVGCGDHQACVRARRGRLGRLTSHRAAAPLGARGAASIRADPLQADQPQRRAHLARAVSHGRSDVIDPGARDAQDADRQIAKRGDAVRRSASAHLRAILVERPIAQVVQLVLDRQCSRFSSSKRCALASCHTFNGRPLRLPDAAGELRAAPPRATVRAGKPAGFEGLAHAKRSALRAAVSRAHGRARSSIGEFAVPSARSQFHRRDRSSIGEIAVPSPRI